jgi:hypothetical protein
MNAHFHDRSSETKAYKQGSEAHSGNSERSLQKRMRWPGS